MIEKHGNQLMTTRGCWWLLSFISQRLSSAFCVDAIIQGKIFARTATNTDPQLLPFQLCLAVVMFDSCIWPVFAQKFNFIWTHVPPCSGPTLHHSKNISFCWCPLRTKQTHQQAAVAFCWQIEECHQAVQSLKDSACATPEIQSLGEAKPAVYPSRNRNNTNLPSRSERFDGTQTGDPLLLSTEMVQWHLHESRQSQC